jgi:hypothetical protein
MNDELEVELIHTLDAIVEALELRAGRPSQRAYKDEAAQEPSAAAFTNFQTRLDALKKPVGATPWRNPRQENG